jgi:hypothetical protein
MKDRQIDLSDIPALRKTSFKQAILWPKCAAEHRTDLHKRRLGFTQM